MWTPTAPTSSSCSTRAWWRWTACPQEVRTPPSPVSPPLQQRTPVIMRAFLPGPRRPLRVPAARVPSAGSGHRFRAVCRPDDCGSVVRLDEATRRAAGAGERDMVVHAARVVHCTNGYNELLPQLSRLGWLVPVRNQVSAPRPGPGRPWPARLRLRRCAPRVRLSSVPRGFLLFRPQVTVTCPLPPEHPLPHAAFYSRNGYVYWSRRCGARPRALCSACTPPLASHLHQRVLHLSCSSAPEQARRARGDRRLPRRDAAHGVGHQRR